MISCANMSQPPNSNLIDSAVFTGLTNGTKRQTCYATPSVAIDRVAMTSFDILICANCFGRHVVRQRNVNILQHIQSG